MKHRLSYLVFVLVLGFWGTIGVCRAEAPLTGAAYRLADRAYRQFAAGDFPAAEASTRAAIKFRPHSRQLQTLLMTVLDRRGDHAAAEKLADRLIAGQPNDALMRAQRGFMRQVRGDYIGAKADFSRALASGRLDAKASRNVRLALADSSLAEGDAAAANAALAPLKSDYPVLVRRARAAALVGDSVTREQALRAAEQLAKTADERAEIQALLMPPPVPPAAVLVEDPLDTAYAALRVGDDRSAFGYFQSGLAARPDAPATTWVDAGYVARRLVENTAAVAWFSRALDLWNAAPPGNKPFDESTRFGLRRIIQEINRHVGIVASFAYQGGAFNDISTLDLAQGGLEAYWQPDEIGNRNNRIFQLFARGLENLYDGNDGPVGSDTAQAAVGMRYKPFSDWNLMLTLERLLAVGDLAQTDWLARIGFSLDEGVDLRPWQDDWRMWLIFAESDYLFNQDRFIQTIEVRYGHSYRSGWLLPNLVVSPYLVAGGDYDSQAASSTALGIGPGISIRHWFNETRYEAPASWAELTLQYRFKLTDAERGEGLILRATLWY